MSDTTILNGGIANLSTTLVNVDGVTITGNGSEDRPLQATGSGRQLDITGIISPPALANGINNNYNPAGLSSASIVLLEGGAPSSLSGLAAQPDGRVVVLANRNNLSDITLLEENAGSLPANRFRFSSGASESWTLSGYRTAVLFYDTSISRWRVWSIFTTDFPGLTSRGDLVAQAGLFTSGSITPPAIAGTVNDYTPGGPTASYAVLRQDLSANATLTGLGALGTGRRVIIRNLSTTYSLTLAHENAGSVAVDRFNLPGGANLVIPPFGSKEVIFDATVDRWFVVS